MGGEEFQMLPAIQNHTAGFSHQREELLKGQWLLLQRGVDGAAEPLLKRRRPVAAEYMRPVVFPLTWFRFLNDGQTVLRAEDVTASSQSESGVMKIPKLPPAVQRRTVPYDMVVYMGFIGMGADEKSVFPLGEPHRELIPDTVSIFRRNLSGLETLPDMVSDDISFSLIPPRERGILLLG
jgi:hypothetical protein